MSAVLIGVVAAAIGREEIAGYVNGLFIVYIALVLISVLMSWIPRLPDSGPLGAIVEFVRQTTDPYLNLFRRVLPPVRAGGLGLDLSPMLGLFVLIIGQALVVGAIDG